MTLEELNKQAACIDAEVCDAGQDDSELEEDLTDSLELLEQALVMFEDIVIKGGKIVRIPNGMMDLMEEVAEHLSQWDQTSS